MCITAQTKQQHSTSTCALSIHASVMQFKLSIRSTICKKLQEKLDNAINSCMHVLLTRFLSQSLSLHLKLSLLESTTCMPYLPCIILAWKTKMLNYFIIIKIVKWDLLEILLCHVVKLWYNIEKQTFLWNLMVMYWNTAISNFYALL